MMMWGMPLKFFWFMPLLCLVMFLFRTFYFKRSLSGFAGMPSLLEREPGTSSEKSASAPIPEELKQAGQQILENLDWDIRFLERQRAEINDPKKQREVEEELRRKRDDYQATVKRLEL